MDSPSEQSPEEIWQEKWQTLQKLDNDLLNLAMELMKKWRLPCKDREDPDSLEWKWGILSKIFERRLQKNKEELRKTIAFHPFIGSTKFYHEELPFDLPGDAIQKCAEQLLVELRAADESHETSLLQL